MKRSAALKLLVKTAGGLLGVLLFCESAAFALCSTPNASIGSLDFQGGVFKYCDGTNWLALASTSFPLQGSNGSAAAPTYSFSAGTNTGMYSTGAGTIAFATAGTAKMILDSAGNVGIGTTTPTYKLDVNGNMNLSGGTLVLYKPDPTYSLALVGTTTKMDSSGFSQVASTSGTSLETRNGPLTFNTGAGAGVTERMRIDSSGNVGIGTTSPGYKLEVAGDVRVSGDLNFAGNRQSLFAGGMPPNYPAIIRDRSVVLRKEFGPSTAGTNIAITAAKPLGHFDVDLYFSGDANGTGVGVGWANVQFDTMLNNAGTALIFANSKVTLKRWTNGSFYTMPAPNVAVSSSSATNVTLTVAGGDSSYATGLAAVKFNGSTYDAGGVSAISLPGGAPTSTSWIAYSGVDTDSSNNLLITTNNTERVRVDSSGNVGIGTSNPVGILDVKRDQAGYTMQRIENATATAGEGMLIGQDVTGASTKFLEIAYMNASAPNGNLYDIPQSAHMGVAGTGGLVIGTVSSAPLIFNTGGYANGNERMRLTSGGSLGLGYTSPSYLLDVNGDARVATLTYSSDERLKKNVTQIEAALEKILRLRGVSYSWRTGEFPKRNFSSRKQVGLIAQEVEQVFPELVYEDNEGFKSVNYPALVAPLVEATRELASQNDATQVRLEKLEAENKMLKSYICAKDPKASFCQGNR